ncbi:helix-turn-helix domain-containing protein [Spirillospora sp. NPDC048911]|uniref:helix-turn-helix domain-containing protein n=1 Tax=Spirillospora sp. NPDC048911 TaxID=3364527 RepID=UPI003713868E
MLVGRLWGCRARSWIRWCCPTRSVGADRKGAPPQDLAGVGLRARIVLLCAEAGTIAQVAERAGRSWNTVSKWRSRFCVGPAGGFSDEPLRRAGLYGSACIG